VDEIITDRIAAMSAELLLTSYYLTGRVGLVVELLPRDLEVVSLIPTGASFKTFKKVAIAPCYSSAFPREN
jgi:hypothetical protein